MRGRRPIPIALKRLAGDTRQRGVQRHEQMLSQAFEPKRGRPTLPLCLRSRKKDGKIVRLRLAIARTHWKYLCEQLESEGLLAAMDEGILTGLAVNYALMIEAARDGEMRTYAELYGKYMAASDRMGLNESARARLPKPDVRKQHSDPLMDAIAPRKTA